MEEVEDRISSLPDTLLAEIMSRLKTKHKSYVERIMTTKEVIRTTVTISKRWQHLWTKLPNLIFMDEFDTKNSDLTDYFAFIHKTLLTHKTPFVKLNEFQLGISFNSRDYPLFKFQAISWIHHAIVHRSVQKVNLRLFDTDLLEFSFEDALFFNNKCFTDITLSDCVLNPSVGVISWENLENLHLSNVRLDEAVIRNIFSGTPCLKGLEFEKCHGYRLIDITSKSLTMFRFNNYNSFDDYLYLYGEDNYIYGIEINAPHLSALKIKGGMCLKNLLLLNVSSLVQVELDYCNLGYLRDFGSKLAEEMMLSGLLESLSHVKDISFGRHCLKVLSRLESKGFHFFEGTDDDDTATDSNLSDDSPEIVAENAKGFEQFINEVIKTTTEDCDRKKSYLTTEVSQSRMLENEHRLLNEKVITDEQNVKETNELLLQQILELEKEVACKNEKITRLEDENTKLKVEIQATVSDVQQAKDHAQLLNSIIEIEKSKVVMLEKQHNELQVLVTDAGFRAKSMEEELEAAEKKVSILTSTISELKQGQADQQLLIKQIDSQSKSIHDLQERIATAMSIHEDQTRELNTKLDDCKCEMTQMAVMNRLKEDVWNIDVGKLKMQLVTKDDVIKELATRLDSIQVVHAEVCSVVEDVEKVNNELMLKMVELKRKVIGSDKLFQKEHKGKSQHMLPTEHAM